MTNEPADDPLTQWLAAETDKLRAMAAEQRAPQTPATEQPVSASIDPPDETSAIAPISRQTEQPNTHQSEVKSDGSAEQTDSMSAMSADQQTGSARDQQNDQPIVAPAIAVADKTSGPQSGASDGMSVSEVPMMSASAPPEISPSAAASAVVQESREKVEAVMRALIDENHTLSRRFGG